MDNTYVSCILKNFQEIIAKTSIRVDIEWFFSNVSVKSIFDQYKTGFIKKTYLRHLLKEYPDVKIIFMPQSIERGLTGFYITFRAELYDEWILDEFHKKFVSKVHHDDAFEHYSDNILFLRTRQYSAFATLNKYPVMLQDVPNEITKLL